MERPRRTYVYVICGTCCGSAGGLLILLGFTLYVAVKTALVLAGITILVIGLLCIVALISSPFITAAKNKQDEEAAEILGPRYFDLSGMLRVLEQPADVYKQAIDRELNDVSTSGDWHACSLGLNYEKFCTSHIYNMKMRKSEVFLTFLNESIKKYNEYRFINEGINTLTTVENDIRERIKKAGVDEKYKILRYGYRSCSLREPYAPEALDELLSIINDAVLFRSGMSMDRMLSKPSWMTERAFWEKKYGADIKFDFNQKQIVAVGIELRILRNKSFYDPWLWESFRGIIEDEVDKYLQGDASRARPFYEGDQPTGAGCDWSYHLLDCSSLNPKVRQIVRERVRFVSNFKGALGSFQAFQKGLVDAGIDECLFSDDPTGDYGRISLSLRRLVGSQVCYGVDIIQNPSQMIMSFIRLAIDAALYRYFASKPYASEELGIDKLASSLESVYLPIDEIPDFFITYIQDITALDDEKIKYLFDERKLYINERRRYVDEISRSLASQTAESDSKENTMASSGNRAYEYKISPSGSLDIEPHVERPIASAFGDGGEADSEGCDYLLADTFSEAYHRLCYETGKVFVKGDFGSLFNGFSEGMNSIAAQIAPQGEESHLHIEGYFAEMLLLFRDAVLFQCGCGCTESFLNHCLMGPFGNSQMADFVRVLLPEDMETIPDPSGLAAMQQEKARVDRLEGLLEEGVEALDDEGMMLLVDEVARRAGYRCDPSKYEEGFRFFGITWPTLTNRVKEYALRISDVTTPEEPLGLTWGLVRAAVDAALFRAGCGTDWDSFKTSALESVHLKLDEIPPLLRNYAYETCVKNGWNSDR